MRNAQRTMLNLINLTNSDAVAASPRWLAPTSVLTPRFFKLGAQIDF